MSDVIRLDVRSRIAEETTNVTVPTPVPTVVTTKGVTLADHLDLRNLPLASTPGGKNFVMKALHPADHEIKTARAPGGMLPSLAVSCDMLETIPWHPTADNMKIVQTANPLFPLSFVFSRADLDLSASMWSNKAFGMPGLLSSEVPYTDTYGAKIQDFIKSVQSYRVISQSITMDFIAPGLANQGTILSAQYQVRPRTISGAGLKESSGQLLLNDSSDIWVYDPSSLSPSTMLMGTNAYTSHAVQGFYQPLKLTKFKFMNAQDGMVPVNNDSEIFASTVPFRLCIFPYMFAANGRELAYGTYPMPKPSCPTVGVTHINGVSSADTVSVRIRVRQVVEIIPTLGSIYSPMTEAPLPPDDLALRMVVEIGQRMKDAYPASYNDLGKLKEVIKGIGRSILKFAEPVLSVASMIPGPIGAVGAAGKTAIAAGKKIAKNITRAKKGKGKKKKKKKTPDQKAVKQKATRKISDYFQQLQDASA